MNSALPIGRLAPSPTGGLHLGNIRTFMWAWLSIRARGGSLLMRIEDLETPRVKPGVAEKMLEDLRWLGFDWDGETAVQTERRAYYTEIFERLDHASALYPCVCTRGEMLAASQGAPNEGDHEIRYPGTCRHRESAEINQRVAESKREPAWRLKTSPGEIEFKDLLSGIHRIDPHAEVGDFVVARAPSNPAYQLAVVADDIAAGVTEVVRGDDLIPSTARQILLYRLLGQSPPSYGHVPLVVGPDGKRLAKRHGDTRIASFRERGIKPERIIGTLGRWSGLIEENDAKLSELISLWSWPRLNRERVILTPEKLAEIDSPARLR